MNNIRDPWVEKYAPKKIEDMVLPEDLRKKFNSYVKSGSLPNLLIYGIQPGIGKSSIIRAIIDEMKCDPKWLNGSGEGRGIDIFDSAIPLFVSAYIGKPKVVIIDECDGLTLKAQASARGSIEDHMKFTSFIMTANYIDNLMEPLINRFMRLDFDEIYKKNKNELRRQIYNRLTYILDKENIEYNKEDVVSVIGTFYPSIRAMVMFLQFNSFEGKLTIDENHLNKSSQYIEILQFVKESKYMEMRNIVLDMNDPGSIITHISKNLDTYFKPESQPNVILILAKYQDMYQNARDKTIPILAMFVEIMASKIKMI